MFLTSIFIIGLAIAAALIWVNRRPRNYPKGPMRLPVLGNLLNMKEVGKLGVSGLFTDYGKIYGPVFSFNLGSHRVVVLNDHKIIKEAMSNPALLGRANILLVDERSGGENRGIIMKDGSHWMEQRRFALKHLKEFGFGSKSIEALVVDDIELLLQELHKKAGTPITTQALYSIPVANTLWTMCSGKRFKHDDPALRDILAMLTKMQKSINGAKPYFYIKGLPQLAPKWSGWDDAAKGIAGPYEFMRQHTRDIYAEFEKDPDAPSTHFSHAFFKEMRNCKDPKSSFYGSDAEKTYVAVIRDLFEAGADTTSANLMWWTLFMALFPEEQKRLQEEIDVVLNGKKPSLFDRTRMPLMEACVLETLRRGSIAQLGLFRRATEETYIAGKYYIPADTIIAPNLGGVHRNPELWPNPDEFILDRFLNEDKTAVIRNPEGFFPFQAGKRVCIGEALAKDQMFMYSASILQEFDITWDETKPKPTLDREPGLLSTPRPHNIVMTPRKDKSKVA